MESLDIHKYVGSGNDFVVVDNRNRVIRHGGEPALAREICARRTSVGADGLILVENSSCADFKMRIINSDGTEAEMCGNGARCVAAFANEAGIAGEDMQFETLAGNIEGSVNGTAVSLQMTDVERVRTVNVGTDRGSFELLCMDTGVPHAVLMVEDLDTQDVAGLGRIIRYHDAFLPAGTNVDFVKSGTSDEIEMRTYERGVEAETLSCGTGAVASAVAYSTRTDTHPPISVRTSSGEVLTISFERSDTGFRKVILQGPVQRVFSGKYFLKG